MSATASTGRNQEPVDNVTGAPDIAAQQKREHQAAQHTSSSSQQHVRSGNEQVQQSGLTGTSNQQASENKTA